MVGLLTANFVFADWRYFYFLFILKDSFAKYRNCALAVLFLQFLKNIPLPSGTRGFQVMRSLLSYNLLSISWWCVVFLWQLSRFCSFFFIFRSLIVMCLGMGFFGFILFGINSAYWICRLMSFATFEKFSVIISLNPLSAIVSFSSETLMWQMLDLLLLPHRSLKFFFCFVFVFFCFISVSFSCSDCV